MAMEASNLRREARYIYTDVQGNNNKFYYIQEQAGATCFVQWGRVGARAQQQTKSFASQNEAASFFNSKCREKETKGYEKLKVINGPGAVLTTVPQVTLAELAAQQIATDCPQTLALVKRLVQANVHNILAAT